VLKDDKTVKIFTLEREHEWLLPLIKESFQKENIAIRIRSFFDSAYDGLYFAQKGYGAIYVFQKDKAAAEKIIKDILSKNVSQK
jgi:hypothetical protein